MGTQRPLVSLTRPANRPNDLSERVSQGGHSAMVDMFNVPEDDRFQIISEHAPKEGMIWPDSFLGIKHGDMVAFVQITCAAIETPSKPMTAPRNRMRSGRRLGRVASLRSKVNSGMEAKSTPPRLLGMRVCPQAIAAKGTAVVRMPTSR